MKQLISLILVLGLVAAGGWFIYFWPYYKDYYTMQEVAESVALTWSSYNKERAVVEIDSQLKKREISYIEPTQFELRESGGEFEVSVAWQVDVYPPLIGGRRLDFEVDAVATKDGRLVND